MKDDDRKARFSVLDEVVQVTEALDKILDNLDRVDAQNEDDVSERLYFSKLNANRALALLLNEGKDKE